MSIMKIQSRTLKQAETHISVFPSKTVTFSSKGQFTVPRSVRQRLGLQPGGRLLLEVRGEELGIRRQGSVAQETAGSLAPYVPRQKEARRV